MKRLLIFGGSFNPPGLHHRALVEELSRRFDEVVVMPCGGRDDKPSVGTVEPIHRAIMCDLAFRGLKNARIDPFDLENDDYTRTYQVEERYAHEGEVWQAFGSDLLAGGGKGESELHKWEFGDRLWRDMKFAVVTREGYPLAPEDRPPHCVEVVAPLAGSSTDIRRLAGERRRFDDLVTPEVAAHIRRYGLYTGQLPARSTMLETDEPRVMVVVDEANPKATAAAKRFAPLEDRENPNMIVVSGGDGAMLHAIQEHWQRRLPFVGVNAGNRGYLMNGVAEVGDDPVAFLSRLRVGLQPMLHVEVTDTGGGVKNYHAFNDVWLERDGGQAAWLEVRVSGQVRLPRLVADGALLATPAGSTSYARAMGATPLLADSPALLLVGNNVLEPLGWKTAILPDAVDVELVSLDPAKRPLRAFVDGRLVGPALSLRVRRSRLAAAEIGFAPHRDMAAKIMDGFFPPAP